MKEVFAFLVCTNATPVQNSERKITGEILQRLHCGNHVKREKEVNGKEAA